MCSMELSPENLVIPFKNLVIKKEVEKTSLNLVAPQVGLEPTTYGLTVRRSNQLSYWGRFPSSFEYVLFSKAMQK